MSEPEQIDMTPSWRATTKMLAVLIRDGDPSGQNDAMKEMHKMAYLADLFVAARNEGLLTDPEVERLEALIDG